MNHFLSQIHYSTHLSTLDWIVFTVVSLLTYLCVFYGHLLLKRSHDNPNSFLEHLLMGRQLTLPLFVATLVATWYGGIFGVTQIAFEKGIYNFVTQGLFWYLAYIIFAFFLAKRIRNYQALTLPDLVGKMFGPISSKVSAVFSFFNTLPVAYAISVGLFLQTLFGGSLLTMTFLGVSLVLVYSITGGFRSIVFSDLAQFFVMCSSVFLIVLFSYFQFGGLTFLKTHLPSTHFDPMGGESVSTIMIWGFIAFSTLVDPSFYQRCFAANQDRTAKVGILISTVIWFGFDICTTLGGLYARAVIPDADPNQSYLIYALQILPNGFRGFVLAGILATILSTLDAFLFIAATSLSFDLAPARLKGKARLHQAAILLIGLLTVWLSTHFDGTVKTVWKTFGSFFSASLLIPMLYGHIAKKKTRDFHFVFASLAAALSVAWWKFNPNKGSWQDIDELYIGMMVSSTILLICYLHSSFCPKTQVSAD